MKKINKLLSVFVISGVVSASLGALAACGHEHAWEWHSEGGVHWQECTECEEKGAEEAHKDVDGNHLCDDCNADLFVKSITINGAATVAVGQTITLTATLTPTYATNKTVTWTSSNTSVATVNATTGVVTGVATGSVTITATVGNVVRTHTVLVTAAGQSATVESITISGADTVEAGQTTTLTATLAPEGAEGTVTWTSSDETKATVNATTGVVTGVAAGEVTITATVGSVSQTKTITVTAAGQVTLTELVVTGKKQYIQGETFNKSDLVVTAKYSNATESDVTANATISDPDLTTLGAKTVTVEYGGKTQYHAIKVYFAPATPAQSPDFTGWTAISTVEEFNDFRTQESATGNYYLTADLDLDGVELETTKVYFSGKFDGNGHTISNAVYVKNAGNKTGILARELMNGAVINNVKFINCVAQYGGETVGIVTGMSNGTVTISQVEFNGCSVKCNNYAGLCIGRTNTKDSVVTLQGITAKNGVSSTVTSYGGTLIGDITAGASAESRAVVNILDCDLDMELKGSNSNGGFLSGRIRSNTNLNIKNVILRNAICPSATGLVCGGGSNNGTYTTVTVENLYVISTNAAVLQSCASSEGTNPVTTFDISYTNCYISCTAPSDAGTYLTAVNKADADVFWLKDTLALNFTKEWTLESRNLDMFRLTESTTNAKSPDAIISSLKVTTANATLRYEKGTDFSAEGLAVSGIYSDGVNLVLNAEEGYTIDRSTYNKDVAGKYTIKVKSLEDNAVVATYQVEVVERTGFSVDTTFAKLAYVSGEGVDLSKLLVYSSWSDGQTLLDTRYTTNEDSIDMTTAGAKELTVSITGFSDVHVTLSVVDTKPFVVDGKTYVNVDADAEIEYSGAKVDGVETFKTINEALDYLVAADLGESVTKVIYVAEGEYHEKLTIPAALKNLKMIGANRATTKIEYDAVEDSVDPFTGNKYTMDCATLHVNAENFGLENITVNNTFDYINDHTKYGNAQGFALTINADGAVVTNVTLFGNQDTLFFKHGRTYLKGCKISGNIDFIFGENDGLAFFDQCVIEAITKSKSQESNNGYVTAMKGDKDNHPTYGYIFDHCEFTDDGNLAVGSMSLGRPWGPGAAVAMINCSFTDAYSKGAFGEVSKPRWYDMSGNYPENAHYYEYGSTGPGALIYTEADEEANPEHVAGTPYAVKGGKLLSEEDAADYTAANLFAKTNGGVTWATDFDYVTALANLESYLNKVVGTAIIIKNGATEITTEIEVPNGDVMAVDVYMSEWNAENKNIVASAVNEEVAVWQNGIKGLSVGETTMTFTCGAVTKTITVKVIEAIPFNVTFVTNGGTEVETQQVYKDKKITAVTTTKDNAVFKGWFKDAAFTTPFNPNEELIVADTTLYARFVDYVDLAKENVTYSFNSTVGDGVSSFQYDGNNQGKTEEAPATFYGLNIWGAKLTSRWNANPSSGDDTQFKASTYVSFNVEKYATVVVTYRSNTSATLGIGEDVETLSSGSSITYVASQAGVVKLSQTADGYITGITVTYPKFIEESTEIDFGSDGDYQTHVGAGIINLSGATFGEEQAKCHQIMSGSVIEFYVKPNATIHISGNWSVAYTINDNSVLTTQAGGADNTGLEYDYFVKDGGKVKITVDNDKNYFYYISVSYPVVISAGTSITFGLEGNYKTCADEGMVTISGNTVYDNGANNVQFKNGGTITFTVAAGCKVTVNGYDNSHTFYKIKLGSADEEEVTEATRDFTVTEDTEIVITDISDAKGQAGNGYLISIVVSEAE